MYKPFIKGALLESGTFISISYVMDDERQKIQQKDDEDIFKVSLIYEIIYFLHCLIKQQ